MDEQKRSWAVIANPKAGKRRLFLRKVSLEDVLRDAGLDVRLFISEYAGHATLLAKTLVEDDGFRDFIIVGGDGTVNEVVNGIMESSVCSSEISFAVIPSGTGNDWARYWNIRKRLKKNIAVIQKGNVQKVDVGRFSYLLKREKKVRYFINSVGIGFDAQVVRYAEIIGRFIHGRPWVYSLSLIAGAAMHISKHLHLKTTDGRVSVDDKVYTMTIANGPYTGGGLKQAAQAIPNDGVFDVMMVVNPKFRQLLSAIYHLFRSNLQEVSCVKYFRTAGLSIDTTRRHKVETDGILIESAKAPFMIEIIPDALNMIVP